MVAPSVYKDYQVKRNLQTVSLDLKTVENVPLLARNLSHTITGTVYTKSVCIVSVTEKAGNVPFIVYKS